jgi:ADP-dependent NAD(P)H-hydrate dehydratase
VSTSLGPPVDVTAASLAALPLPDHAEDAGKADRGQVLVVGGGRETPGAVLLAGLAALRAGAGRLQIATVAGVAPNLALLVPEARVVGLPETDDGELSDLGAEQLSELAASSDAVLLGPGVLDQTAMGALLAAVLGSTTGSVLVDAGAMAAAGTAGTLGPRGIAVPNGGELKLLGADDARTASARLGAVVACRTADTLVAAPDGRAWLDRTGTVGLATSGSGDVAAGVVAGLAARGASPEAAAVWGVHLHGLAGEAVARRVGRLGFLARELLDELPGVLGAAPTVGP